MECGVFLPGFLVEGFSMNRRLVFFKCFIFIFLFLIFKFLLKQFIFPPHFGLYKLAYISVY